MVQTKVADLTMDELKDLIREVIAQTISETMKEPDEGLELREKTELSQAYQAAPDQERSKLELLFNLWLKDLLVRSTSLKGLMDELGEKAQARGLTSEKLEKMLRDS